MGLNAPIEVILFDADGVLQSTPPGRRAALAALLPPEDEDVDGFIDEIFEIERPALAGAGDLVGDMRALLGRRRSTAAPGDILHLLNTIYVHSEMLDIVTRLRESGMNSESYRLKQSRQTSTLHSADDPADA